MRDFFNRRRHRSGQPFACGMIQQEERLRALEIAAAFERRDS
jgi:hypothetical protein